MKFRILIVIVSLVSVFSIRQLLATEMTYAWVGCDGTVVSRTDVGRIQVFYTEPNLAGCQGPKWIDPTLWIHHGSVDRWRSSVSGCSTF